VLKHRLNQSKFSVLVLALLLGGFGCAKGNKKEAPLSTASAPPKLEIVEKLHDFGNATEGDKLTYVFKVKNAGAGTLMIDRVTTSCGCTAAVLKNKEVAPGGEGDIEVTFDTNHRGGENRKSITAFSNDPSSPRAELEIKANVESLLTMVPAFIRLNPELGHEAVQDSWLIGKLKDQAKLKIVEKTGDADVSIELAEKKLDNGTTQQGVHFKFMGKKVGFGNGNLTIETGLPKPDKLQLGFHWTVVGNIQVIPAQLYFSARQGSASERVIRVSSRKTDFKLRDVRVVSGPFTAKIVTPDAGVGYEVHISLKKEIETAPATVTEIGKIELISNDSLEPKKEVPLRMAPQFTPRPMRGPGSPGGLGPSMASPHSMPSMASPHSIVPPIPGGR
jgi:hypothetical protein